MGTKILIIDDDRKLQDLLNEYLEGYGFSVCHRLDGNRVIEYLDMDNPSLVILDIMLPGRDGFEVLKEIRESSQVPVIMLTAKGDDTDRILGLEIGADDYLPKPFNPRELLARIKAVLRRNGPRRKNDSMLVSGDFTLDTLAGMVSYGGKNTELSTTELTILEALMKSPNRVFTRDDLMNIARGRDSIQFERSIDVHISRLRAKLENLSGLRDAIKTVWGRGYMFMERT